MQRIFFYVLFLFANRMTMDKNAVHRQFIGFQNGFRMLFMFHRKPLDGVTHTIQPSATLFFTYFLLTSNPLKFLNNQHNFLIRIILHFSHSNFSKQLKLFGKGRSFFYCLCTTSDSCQFSYVSDIRWKTRSLSYCMCSLS